jgi:hypothetical protein
LAAILVQVYFIEMLDRSGEITRAQDEGCMAVCCPCGKLKPQQNLKKSEFFRVFLNFSRFLGLFLAKSKNGLIYMETAFLAKNTFFCRQKISSFFQ